MLDLRQELPNALDVDGVLYPIYTDFRTWIEVDKSVRDDGIMPYGIFKTDPPKGGEWQRAAKEFLLCPNATPRTGFGNSKERSFDFILDGAYIYASFMQAYGIDLMNCEYMHWFVFRALFDGLPDTTKMAQIMSYRTWSKSSKKYDDQMRELKRIWRLPEPHEDEQMADAKAIAEQMYEREMERFNE